MKKLKILCSAAAVLLMAFAGCDLEIRESYVAPEYASVEETEDNDGITWTYSCSETETVGGESDAINVETVGTTWANQTNSSWKMENPLNGLSSSDYESVTVSFQMYATEVMTYSGVFGIYDSATGGFIWFTNSLFFINTTANNTAASNTQYYCDYTTACDPIGANASALDTWIDVEFVITEDDWTLTVGGTTVGPDDVAASGGTINDAWTWLFDYADVLRIGNGVSFWDNAGSSTWIRNISITAAAAQ